MKKFIIVVLSCVTQRKYSDNGVSVMELAVAEAARLETDKLILVRKILDLNQMSYLL